MRLGMLGFSDVSDLDFLSSREVARRMGFMSWASLGRALKTKGEDLPPALLRGKHRGDIVKAWFQSLNAAPSAADGSLGGDPRPAHSPPAPAGVVIALEARRRSALARLRSV